MRKLIVLAGAVLTLLGSLVIEVALFGLLLSAESRQAWRWTILVGIIGVAIGAGLLWPSTRRNHVR